MSSLGPAGACWQGRPKDCSTSSSNPSSKKKREPASAINTEAVDSLKVLDLERPIGKGDLIMTLRDIGYVPTALMLRSKYSSCAKILIRILP